MIGEPLSATANKATPAALPPLRVALIAKPGGANTGVGRYTAMLTTELAAAGVGVTRLAPTLPALPAVAYDGLRRAGLDARAFLSNYPLRARYPQADVYHLTAQNLASLLRFQRPPGPAIVTVHDIFPYMLRDTPGLSVYRTAAERLFDRVAMAALRRADLLLADSSYSAACVTEHLGIPASRIRVVHLGLDAARFRPTEVAPSLRERYGLQADARYLIYVGSEDPRKNLSTLVRALALLRERRPDVELLKVGRAHFAAEREKLVTLARELGVLDAIHFLEETPEDDLAPLYNLAAVAVLPSLYEGFGFGALEAQACGTPLVYADVASLPEISGGAGLPFTPGPDAPAAVAAAVLRILDEPTLAGDLRARGLANAARFRWGETARVTSAAYRSVLRGGRR